MPRKKPVLSEDERRLIIFTREYVEYLLGYDDRVEILDSIRRGLVREFSDYLRKLDHPDNYNVSDPEFYYGTDVYIMDKKFFRILDAFLEEIAESKSPALRTLNWRARHLRTLLNGLPKLFTAK